MSQEVYNNLITAISHDNLALFSATTKDHLNLKFGRFPILSLCYLYNSKKILKKYRKELWQVKDYTTINEPFEFYQKFRSVAGRTLRLYTNEKATVSPIEMLAILHEDNLVKKLYRKHKHTLLDKVKRNLKSIYTIYNQDPYILTYKIKLKPRKLTRKERLPYKLAISSALAMIVIFVSTLLTLNFTIGLGTESNPYKIYTEKQFLSALNSTAYYKLEDNLQLENIDIETFKGKIDGNNKLITMTSIPNNYLIETNKGTIKNIKIVYPETTQNIESSLSLFVNENKGTINNVKISCDRLTLYCKKTNSEDIYITGIAKNNSGLIDNCLVQFDCNVTTTNNGECFVGGVTGENSGTIRNTTISTNSSIIANEADLSGIAITNTKTGKITNCTNHSNIHQSSQINEWSPTIAGIALTNYGTIDRAINKGNLSIVSTNNTNNAQGNIFVGGISANNFGTINKSLNSGNITTSSLRLLTYAGGIVGYSSYWIENEITYYPLLNNCGASGTINVTTENENIFAFVGGIGGSYQYGEIIDCYSLCDFTNSATEDKYFFGLLLGSSYLDIWFNNIYLSPSNIYLAYTDTVEHHIGSLINGSSIVSTGIDLNEGITVTTEEQIKLQEIYFDE